MGAILLDWAQITTKGDLKALKQAFQRAGARIVSVDTDGRQYRSLGISYKILQLSFEDNQKVTLYVKATGDIYKVRVNGSELPIKNHDDQYKAVGEIVSVMDSGRAKFQAKMLREKKNITLPKGIRSVAVKQAEILKIKEAQIDDAIAEAKKELADLESEAYLDSIELVEGGMKLSLADGHYVGYQNGNQVTLPAESNVNMPEDFVFYADESTPEGKQMKVGVLVITGFATITMIEEDGTALVDKTEDQRQEPAGASPFVQSGSSSHSGTGMILDSAGKAMSATEILALAKKDGIKGKLVKSFSGDQVLVEYDIPGRGKVKIKAAKEEQILDSAKEPWDIGTLVKIKSTGEVAKVFASVGDNNDENALYKIDTATGKRPVHFKDLEIADEYETALYNYKDSDAKDAYELLQLEKFAKKYGKVFALKMVINNVEGDFSQLSPSLAKIAKKYEGKYYDSVDQTPEESVEVVETVVPSDEDETAPDEFQESMFDSASKSSADNAKDVIPYYQRGVRGPIYVSKADVKSDPRFIPVRNEDGSRTGDEVHIENLYKSQAEANRAGDSVKKGLKNLGMLDDVSHGTIKYILDSAKNSKDLIAVLNDVYGVTPDKAPVNAILWAAGRVWAAGGDWKKQLEDVNKMRKGKPHAYSGDVVKITDDEDVTDSSIDEAILDGIIGVPKVGETKSGITITVTATPDVKEDAVVKEAKKIAAVWSKRNNKKLNFMQADKDDIHSNDSRNVFICNFMCDENENLDSVEVQKPEYERTWAAKEQYERTWNTV